MAVSYNKLWKLMIDKKINKSQLCKKIKISSSTMAKMTNEQAYNQCKLRLDRLEVCTCIPVRATNQVRKKLGCGGYVTFCYKKV